MKKILRILCISFLLTACSGKNKIPPGVIPPQKMQAVLWDMLRADGYISDYLLPKDSALNKEKESIKLYEQIFRIHQIDKEEFRKSFLFYQAHPSIFKLVVDSLNARHISTVNDVPAVPDSSLKNKNKGIELP